MIPISDQIVEQKNLIHFFGILLKINLDDKVGEYFLSDGSPSVVERIVLICHFKNQMKFVYLYLFNSFISDVKYYKRLL
jgi:hypothetical protein